MFTWNTFLLTKQTITSCSVTEKFRKVNFLSHDRVCDDRIRHLNHLWSLIVLSTKVNNLTFWKFEFSQEHWCHGCQNDPERGVGMVQAGMTHQAIADHFNVSRITISRLMIRLRQTGRTYDRPCSMRQRCEAIVVARGGHTRYWTLQTFILHDNFCLSMICSDNVDKFSWYFLICYAHMNLNYTIFVDFFSLCQKYWASNPCIVSFVD